MAIVILSCERTVKENLAISESSYKQIKTLLESIHDPIVNSGKVEYNAKNSNNSLITKSIFNSKGALVSKSVFNSMGNLESKVTLKYDEKGNTIETDTYSSNGTLSRKRVNVFDSSNKLIESNEFDDKGKKIEKQTVRLNSGGHMIVITHKLVNGNFVKTIESVMDEHERNTENYYFANETIRRMEINKYDANGNRIELAKYDPVMKQESITHYKFDDQNNIIEVVELNTNLMITSKVISKYDGKKNLSESWTYGILGQLTRHVRHSYEYDESFNWVKNITFVNNKPASVTLHRIEYY